MRELPGTSRASTGLSRTGVAWRVAAVAVLLAVTVAGLRARGAFSHTPQEALSGASRAVLVTALAVAEGIALVAFILVLAMARPQKNPPDDEEPLWRPRFPWWAKTLAVLAAVAVLVTPFAVLLTSKNRPKTAAAPLTRHGVPLHGASRLAEPSASSAWPLIAGMVIAIAVVVTVTVLSRRKRAAGPAPAHDRHLVALGEGLAAALAALHQGGEPRQAIIACYGALERGFAAAGSAPAAADTPTEVLVRAIEAGLVRSGSAAALTGLFRRARYSAEPMTSADADEAASALDRLQADLHQQTGLAGAGARS
jgi:hypothetical protein